MLLSKKIFMGAGILGILGITFVGGVFYAYKHPLLSTFPVRSSEGYSFISPLLYLDNPKDLRDYGSMDRQISDYIKSAENKGDVLKASVYFRDFNKSRWDGINEDDLYVPASIFKVWGLIAYYKEAETDPQILNKKLIYPSGAPDEFRTLQSGNSYSVSDLLDAMIINSDNGAAEVLSKNIPQNYLDNVLSDLGIQVVAGEDPSRYEISPKSLSVLFRVLYSATYLSNNLSEKALGLLSQTKFADGIVAGVPSVIIVSHKYGQYEDPNGNFELHDCGIVYYPMDNYFLCVMTTSKNWNNSKEVIKNISSLVYKSISRNQIQN
jgi:beta-lactamase class A